jgi:hypothetical protein
MKSKTNKPITRSIKKSVSSRKRRMKTVQATVLFQPKGGKAMVLGCVTIPYESYLYLEARDTVIGILKNKGLKEEDIRLANTYGELYLADGSEVSLHLPFEFTAWAHLIADHVKKTRRKRA